MEKVALFNLDGKYTLYAIMETRTYEPVFLNWTEHALDSLTEYGCVVYYSPDVDADIVRTIRRNMCFLNIRLIVYTDSLDKGQKRELLSAGADMVDLLPERDIELFQALHIMKSYSANITKFQKESLHPFKQAMDEIFNRMLDKKIEFVDSYLSSTQFHYGDITGTMTIINEHKGVIAVTCYEGLAKKLISNIMAIPEDKIDDELEKDGFGEILNMIAGGAKWRSSYTGVHFLMSTPSIIKGEYPDETAKSDTQNVIIVYKTEEQYIAIVIGSRILGRKDTEYAM